MIPLHTLEKYSLSIGLVSLLMIGLSMAMALVYGAVPISLTQLLDTLLAQADAQTHLILLDLRLPRILLALCIGALLALCGTVSQGLFRNPLADPSLIGVSAGASAGAAAVIVLLDHVQWTLAGLSLVSLGAFAGGLLTVVLVYRMALVKK